MSPRRLMSRLSIRHGLIGRLVQNWPGTPDNSNIYPSVVWLGLGLSAVVVGPRRLVIAPHGGSFRGAELYASMPLGPAYVLQSLGCLVDDQVDWAQADLAVLTTRDDIPAVPAYRGAVVAGDRTITTVGYCGPARQYQDLHVASLTCQEHDAALRWGPEVRVPHIVCDDCRAGVSRYDSGGAAFVARNGRWELVGVTFAALGGERAAELEKTCVRPNGTDGFGGIFVRTDGEAGSWIASLL